MQGERAPPSAQTFNAGQARFVPGTFGDPLRAVETLPGIAPTASGLPYFYLRGAPPANTGYFIDGVPVPLLFHIGPGPSVLAPGLLDHVDLYPGPAPVRYGRYVGGVIAAETRPPSETLRLEYGARLFDANVLGELPFDEKTSILVASRYGYPNLILSAVAPDLSLNYWDYLVRLSHRPTPRDTLSVFAFGALDRLHDNTDGSDIFAAQFHRVDLRYDHRFDQGSFRIATTVGYDRTGEGAPGQPVNDSVSAIGPRLRVEWKQRAGPMIDLRAGGDISGTRATFDLAPNGGVKLTVPASAEALAGAYVEASFQLTPALELVPGARVDVYRTSAVHARHTWSALDPRLFARYQANPWLLFNAAAGIAHQLPTYFVPVPGFDVDPAGGLQRSYGFSLGPTLALARDLELAVTGFYRLERNVTDYVSDCGKAQDCQIINRVDGSTYGAEVLLKRSLSARLTGWLSYTLSRAERVFEGHPYLSPFDRTQAFSGVLGYRFGSSVRAGVRVTYYTGRPDIPKLFFPGSPESSFDFRPGQALPQYRLPDFYRLDLRLEKRWSLDPERGRFVSVVLEFFNATLNKEALDYRCQYGPHIRCVARTFGPIALPSLGVEGAL